MSDLRGRIYAVVRRITKGRVTTYGEVARLAGIAGHARQVGYALHDLPAGTRMPWHRVVNSRGEISRRTEPHAEIVQKLLLEDEGVVFDGRGRIRLERYRWIPRRGRKVAPEKAHPGRRRS